MTFDLDRLISDCADAATEKTPTKAVSELVARAVSEPNAISHTLGTPERAEIQRLHVSDKLTVLNVIWAPGMTLMPHNHNMWAVIGVYGRREDNIFWRRCKDNSLGLIEAAGAKSIGPAEVRPLGPAIRSHTFSFNF